MNKFKNSVKLIGIFFLLILGINGICFFASNLSNKDEVIYNSVDVESYPYFSQNDSDVLYLSDIDYIKNQSYVGWDRIRYDEVNGGAKISVRIENNIFTFAKGIWAHASSQVTYDISSYNYKYFTAFIGMNSTAGGNGVTYAVYTSTDGNDWGEAKYKEVKGPRDNATFVKIDITGAKYLRLSATAIGGNGNAHSVFADAKLVNQVEEENDFIHELSYYDEILSKHSVEYNYENNYRLILERELINKIGYWNLKFRAESSAEGKAIVDWIFGSNDRIEQIIEVGELSNTNKFLDIIKDIYTKYSEKLSGPNGAVYQKLMIGLAAAYSTDRAPTPLVFSLVSLNQDYVERFGIYVDFYENDKLMRPTNGNLTGPFTTNDWFKDFHVELMRMIMQDATSNIDLVWLNGYTHDKNTMSFWIVPYAGGNYAADELYDENNYDKYNEKYLLSKYNVPYGLENGSKVSRYWMVIEKGNVCWGESRFGQSMYRVNGVPATGGYSPHHEPFLTYHQNEDGKGIWIPRYGGWSAMGSTWGGGSRYRYIFNWSNKYFTDQNVSGPKAASSSGYMYLAQENLNNIEEYRKSLYYNLAANSYNDDNQKLETYFKALDVNNLNLDSYDYIINIYKKKSVNNEGGTITSSDWKELAKKIADSYTYYPVAMYDLFKVIRPYLNDVDKLEIDRLEVDRLNQATKATANETIHYTGSVQHANWLLGRVQEDPATFSFDGENAGKIIESDNYQVPWRFSLDGGKTYIALRDGKRVKVSDSDNIKDYIVDKSITLTAEELASITDENDIIIGFMGLGYKFRIDITTGVISSDLFANDLENRVVGSIQGHEWRFNENENWTHYNSGTPDLTGDKTVMVRRAATGKVLPSDSTTYTFTNDIINNKRKYIPVSHLSLEEVSTEATGQNGSAIYSLDANYNTRWHSAWNGSDTKRYITVKLDKPYNISAVEFVPAGGGNGKIYDGTVYGSEDGENWFIISQARGITYRNNADTIQQAIDNIKSFEVDIPQSVQYVKIVADRSNGNWFAARAFNFYEDTTIKNVASFSFDGANAGIISLLDEFKNTKWKYSIDGGKNWKSVKENSHQLTTAEIEQINAEDMIKIKLDNDENEYKITLKKGSTPESGYLNDLENRPIGQPDKNSLEWKVEGSDNWTSYSDEEPDVKGTKTLYVRRKASGLAMASDAIEYNFTEDNQPDQAKYIRIDHLSIHDFSNTTVPSRGEEAHFSIDGLPTTMWHTNRTTTTMHDPRWIIIKLDNPKYISKIQYVRKHGYLYGILKDGIVSTSMDGENWEEAVVIEDLFNVSTRNELSAADDSRDIVFNTSKKAQYIKIELTKSYDYVHGNRDGQPMDYFFSAAMFNLFEDITKKEAPTAEIEYDITQNTNQNVTAKLVNPSTKIRITNNSGRDTHVFTENGSFTFEFVDEYGIKGTATAKVDWIIKTLPTATITYNTTKLTNQNVTAEISFDRDKTRIVDEDGNTIKTLSLGEKYIVTFTNNGTKEVKFVGPYGNAGSKKLKVDWIDKTVPTATIEYSTTKPTNKDVVATIKFNENNVTVTSEGGNTHTFTENGEFTFEFTDKAGNKGTAKAKVDYIDRKLAMPTITYNTKNPTNKDVVATVTFDKENVEITNNDGKNTYTFTENGTFEFKFIGPAGNEGVATAKVTWIDKEAPKSTITYNPSTFTNKDVIATISFDEENVTITNNGGKNTYTFKENDLFVFEFKDAAGNKGTATAVVNLIDRTIPTAKVKYSTKTMTNENVVVTLTEESEEITVTSEGGKTHTFTENGTFTFEFVDRAGNIGTTTAVVDWIDKEAPVGTISYSKTTPTKDGVIATISFNEENVTINNNSGKNTYVFKENGEFTFEFTDKVGNKGTATAKVDWISKDAPIGTVSYSINELTNKDVIATLNVKDGVKVTNNNGSKTYTFTKNGTFKFEFVDESGNKGATIASVDWIDKEAPVAEVSFNKSTITNKDVIATINFNEENVTITNNNHKNTYTFTKNGEFTFEFEDSLGNRGTKKITVNWIDKEAPVGTITYNTKNPTNKDVIATIKFNEENVTITNNDNRNTHTFTKNGEFTFEFVDNAGNNGTATAKVDWIDKEAPVGKITYSINELTNKDVIATISFEEDVIITSKTHTFTKNGEYTFEFTDKVGNKGTAVAKVDWIDKEAPVGKITYSISELTNKDVVATISFEEEDVIITDKTHTFTKNGEYTFEFTDKVGNKGTVTAKVDWIDKEAPIGTFTYSVTDITNKDVVATIKFNEENVTITNNDGKNTYTFTENGEFIFEFTDKVGNRGTATAKVDWINKNAPIGTITYGPKELTNKDVIATLNVKDGVKVTNNNGSKTYTFKDNGVFTFEFVDESGNKGTATAKVDWIDKKTPVGEVTYNFNSLTNKDVVATIKFDEENVTINNNSGKNTYVFKENGEFTFEFTDMAGNKGTKVVKVDWIDKKVAKAIIKYNITELTNQDVIATVTFDKKDVTIKNNNSSNSYTFTKNGEFVFEYVDKAGNEGTVKAVVNWISKVVPECSVEYNINKLTNQDVIATIKFKNNDITITNNSGKNTYTFKENGEFTFEFVDKAGNKGDYTVKVDWIDKVVATAKIIYSTTTETANDVIATITSDEEIFVINNNGMKAYTFKENGEFEFAYEDSLGNKGHLLAKVNWIKKNNNSNNNANNNNNNSNNNANNNNNNSNNNANNNNNNNNVPSTKPVDKPISSNNASANNNSYGTGNTSSDTSKDNTIVDVADPKDSDDEKDNLQDEEEGKLELRHYLDQDDKTNMNIFKIILFILIAIFISLSFVYGLILKRNNSK